MHSRFSYQLSAVAAAILLFAFNAHAQLLTFQANLSGPAESPPNASPGSGFTTVTYDPVTHLLSVQVSFTGLLGTTTNSHIHSATAVPFAGTAGVATQTPSFANMPLGVTSGMFSQTLDLTQATSWNSVFIAGNGGTTATAESAFIAAMNQGRTYLNIHTTVVPGGEIRGFLRAVPETGGTATLMMIALAGVVITTYRVRRT